MKLSSELRSVARLRLMLGALAVYGGMCSPVLANDAPATKKETSSRKDDAAKPQALGEISTTSASSPKTVGAQLREALGMPEVPNKKLTVKVPGRPSVANSRKVVAASSASKEPSTGHEALAAAQVHGEVHWDYEGANGPANWGKLKPEFNLCAIGKRQSPINIDESTTLQGPAEPLGFGYNPSNGTVINNGHTIQVDVQGNNTLTVRGSMYRLLQFHFHTPSEEQINFKRYPMVAHLVHRNDEGQLAVVAILLQEGNPSLLIDKVWTYMPLDAGDQVRMPAALLDLNELLPSDQRYFQFMGSLTTPPCSENVLWMVMKQPVQISRMQYRLFTQLYSNNARPVQPINGRPIRDAR